MAWNTVHPQRVNGHRTIQPYLPGFLSFPKRKCVVCGVKYKPGRIFQKFCSPKCRRKPPVRVYAPRSCKVCLKKFTPNRSWQKFCSYKCQERHHFHPRRRPFETMEECLRRIKTYKVKYKKAWKKRKGRCRFCSKPLMKNSKSWCEMHWFAMAVNRYGFKFSEWIVAKKLLEKQNHKCPYTGVKLIPGVNASIEHKKPRSKFPHLKNDWTNIQWSHWYVNNMKQTLTEKEFERRLESFKNKKPSAFRRRVLRIRRSGST